MISGSWRCEAQAIDTTAADRDRYIRSASDIDSAVNNVAQFEAIKRAAKDIGSPLGGAFSDFKRQMELTIGVFKEMGATAEDWADLQKVATAQFDDTLKGLLKGLQDFRDSLFGGELSFKSPIEQLRLSGDKFAGLESKIASGQFVSSDEFTSSAAGLLDLAREVYGSTPEFAQYQARVLEATDKLINVVNTEAEKYKPVVDAITNQTNVIGGILSDIRSSLGGTTSGTRPSYGGSGTNFESRFAEHNF
jgi:hypothetical protein